MPTVFGKKQACPRILGFCKPSLEFLCFWHHLLLYHKIASRSPIYLCPNTHMLVCLDGTSEMLAQRTYTAFCRWDHGGFTDTEPLPPTVWHLGQRSCAVPTGVCCPLCSMRCQQELPKWSDSMKVAVTPQRKNNAHCSVKNTHIALAYQWTLHRSLKIWPSPATAVLPTEVLTVLHPAFQKSASLCDVMWKPHCSVPSSFRNILISLAHVFQDSTNKSTWILLHC